MVKDINSKRNKMLSATYCFVSCRFVAWIAILNFVKSRNVNEVISCHVVAIQC
jgi:hypothetical protein